MGSYYEIQVKASRNAIEEITNEYGNSHREFDTSWSYIIDETAINFAEARSTILNIIRRLYEKEIIFRKDINQVIVWFMYEYVEQCNMEFSPEFLKGLSILDVTLCISCWEKESDLFLEISNTK